MVRYVTTRTLGKVIDLKAEDGKTWAQIDSTKLYYDTHYLTVTDVTAAAEEDADTVKVDLADVEKKIRDMEDALKIEDVRNDNSCEGDAKFHSGHNGKHHVHHGAVSGSLKRTPWCTLCP